MPATDTHASTDRIEKRVSLAAPRSRVWKALTSSKEFSTWFGIDLDGPFAEGRMVRGRLTMKNHEEVTLEMMVETIRPETLFSYRWHPGAIDPKVDYSHEQTTLVEFYLDDAGSGTELTIIESGFDQLPATRRVEAFRMNNGGWDSQSKKLVTYVTAG